MVGEDMSDEGVLIILEVVFKPGDQAQRHAVINDIIDFFHMWPETKPQGTIQDDFKLIAYSRCDVAQSTFAGEEWINIRRRLNTLCSHWHIEAIFVNSDSFLGSDDKTISEEEIKSWE
jgi:hypothetical protein